MKELLQLNLEHGLPSAESVRDRTIPLFNRTGLRFHHGGTFAARPFLRACVSSVGRTSPSSGAPFDGGTTYRPGARFGPRSIRAITALDSGYSFETRTARVNGWLLPQEGVVRLQAPRPGIVGSLAVKEGDQVHKGDRLLTLSDELESARLGPTQAQITQRLSERRASMTEERSQQQRLLAQQDRALASRVAALRAEEEQIQSEIGLLRERIEIAQRAVALHRKLNAEGFISEMKVQQVQSELLEQRARLAAAERSRLTAVRERMNIEAERADLPLKMGRDTALLDRGMAELEQERAEAEARREIVVVAPHDGTVTAIHAVPGAKADTGTPLLSIVPLTSRLEAHLYAPSRAIGFVRTGQRVQLRYQAFPYQRFGHYEGVVAAVSRAALSPAELPRAVGRAHERDRSRGRCRGRADLSHHGEPGQPDRHGLWRGRLRCSRE